MDKLLVQYTAKDLWSMFVFNLDILSNAGTTTYKSLTLEKGWSAVYPVVDCSQDYRGDQPAILPPYCL